MSTRHDVFRFRWWTWPHSLAQCFEEFDGVNEWRGPGWEFGFGAVLAGKRLLDVGSRGIGGDAHGFVVYAPSSHRDSESNLDRDVWVRIAEEQVWKSYQFMKFMSQFQTDAFLDAIVSRREYIVGT